MAKGKQPELESIEQKLNVTPQQIADTMGWDKSNVYNSYRKKQKEKHYEALALYTAFKASGATLEQASLQIATLATLNGK